MSQLYCCLSLFVEIAYKMIKARDEISTRSVIININTIVIKVFIKIYIGIEILHFKVIHEVENLLTDKLFSLVSIIK